MQNFCQSVLVISVFVSYFDLAYSLTTLCKDLEWQCENGQCIAIEDRCDGIKNCADGSDETVDHCIHFHCPAYAFQCAYGACIQGSHVCNNHNDCVDGSDEAKSLCDNALNQTEKDKILQGKCVEPLQMECENGICIDRSMICDGQKDCSNGEDETLELCSVWTCPKFAFRCGYGGCIAGNKKCDGKNDCLDGSDEAFELCNKEVSPEFCFIPDGRKYLEIQNLNGERNLKIGDRVLFGTRLKFKCSKGWHLIGAKHSLCDFNGWTNQVPHCMKFCSNYKLQRGLSTVAECSYNDYKISCDEEIVTGTIAKISCAPGYAMGKEIINPPGGIMQCNAEGEWTQPQLQCQPICGVIKNSTSNEMPWDVSLFRLVNSYEFRCHGIILSPKIVIAAEMCFSEIRSADIDEHEMYHIVSGIYTKPYEPFDKIGRAVFNVSEIYIPYSPESFESIAILVLVKYFKFSNTLTPICVHFQKFTTAPYANLERDGEKSKRLTGPGASVSETVKHENKLIHFLVAIKGLTDSDSISNFSSLEGLVRKYIERYQDLY